MKKYETGTKSNVMRRALYYAIEWEKELLAGHAHCNEPDDLIFKEKCKANIRDFNKLRDSLIGKL